ncbi:MAG: TetR/AcrR family transcriptional regulator [Pseudomonadota bacterium]
MEANTTERILDAAERRIRDAGYNGFSFRDLAEDVGIKSASVHYHFPTKEALVATLTERYTERFLQSLEDAPSGIRCILAYRDAFRRSLAEDRRMCLCGVLGAESGGLPDSVTRQARLFFERTIQKLEQALVGTVSEPHSTAAAVVAQLQGAIILARAFGNIAAFDEATQELAEKSS